MAAPKHISKPDENNERLHELRHQYHLTRTDIVRITGYKSSTVDAWLADVASPNARRMPDKALRLLELELGIAKPQFRWLIARAFKLIRELRQ